MIVFACHFAPYPVKLRISQTVIMPRLRHRFASTSVQERILSSP